MGYDYIAFDEHHFKEDLQYADAVPMFRRLMELAAKNGLEFGLKLSNTFPVDVKRQELPSEEMYMAGKSLFPLTTIMGIVALVGLVLDVGGVDRDAAGLLFRSLIDLVVSLVLSLALESQPLGDRSGQRGLAMLQLLHYQRKWENALLASVILCVSSRFFTAEPVLLAASMKMGLKRSRFC